MRVRLIAVLICSLLVLIGCGGGGGGSEQTTSVDVNSAPFAVAGPDQSVLVGTTVQLDGDGSTDPDGDLLSFVWVLSNRPSGSTLELPDRTIINPTFSSEVEGDYVFDLMVNDGIETTVDSVTITFSRTNAAPIANAGPDQNVYTGETVTLTAASSTDADGDYLDYIWVLTSKPTDSTATLDAIDVMTPRFVADVDGVYTFSLTVDDRREVSATADTVTVSATTYNSPPVAVAGPNQTITIGNTAFLDGTGSTDADDFLTYSWAFTTKPTGSTAVLVEPTSPTPRFLVDHNGIYVASLVVSDGKESSPADTIRVTAINNTIPIADAGPDQIVRAGSNVTFSGSGTSSTDGDELAYSWTLLSAPDGVILNNADTVSADIINAPAGTYVAELEVTDGINGYQSDSVEVIVYPIPPVEVELSINAGIALDLCMPTGDFSLGGQLWNFDSCNISGYPGNKIYLRVTNHTESPVTITQLFVDFPTTIDVFAQVPAGQEIVDPHSSLTLILNLPIFQQINGAILTASFDSIDDVSGEWRLSFYPQQ